jgi:hypothetical protein
VSHVLHGRPQHTLRGLSLTVKILIVVALLAAVTAGRLLTDDTESTPLPSVTTTFAGHPEEGSAAIPSPSAYTARPDEGIAPIAVPAAKAARPDEGLAPIAVPGAVDARHRALSQAHPAR